MDTLGGRFESHHLETPLKQLMKVVFAAFAAIGLAAAAPAFAQKAEPPATKAEAAKPAALMDINSASAEELATLKGIGEVRAKAIVKGRPYKGKDDLVRKKIVPRNVYGDIKDQIIARQ